MFNAMYIKKNTLSLAHLLLHFYHPFSWTKITLRTSALPQYNDEKMLCI